MACKEGQFDVVKLMMGINKIKASYHFYIKLYVQHVNAMTLLI